MEWTPACAGARSPSGSRGFTLIELLVAVMIFSLLSLAGVVLLRGSVSTQAAVTERLDALGDVQQGIATLDADLAQAVGRITRTQAGTLAPAFFGRAAQGDAPILQFVRAGWANSGSAPRPSIQKVEYWWRGGRIERIGYPVPDGAAPGPAGLLFDGVTGLQLRFRDGSGAWVDRWAPTNPQAMPAMVEMELTRGTAAPLTLRFLVAPANRPPSSGPAPQGPSDGRARTSPVATGA